jgi:hypothetical protein
MLESGVRKKRMENNMNNLIEEWANYFVSTEDGIKNIICEEEIDLFINNVKENRRLEPIDYLLAEKELNKFRSEIEKNAMNIEKLLKVIEGSI